MLYTISEQAKTQLLAHQEWLQDIKGSLYKRQFRIITHNIQPIEDLEDLATRIQTQNSLQNIPQAQWLGGKPNGSGTIVLGLETPEEANQLLNSSLLLDYKIKTAYIFKTKPRYIPSTAKRMDRLYYKESQKQHPKP